MCDASMSPIGREKGELRFSLAEKRPEGKEIATEQFHERGKETLLTNVTIGGKGEGKKRIRGGELWNQKRGRKLGRKLRRGPQHPPSRRR